MRVLAITNMYPPHHYGGYEQLCRDVVGRFRESGHETAVLTSDWRVPGVADDVGDDDGGDVERTLRLYWADHQIVDPGAVGRWRTERHNQRVLASVLDSFEPDVVSLWAMGCLSMGLVSAVARRGIPMVSVVCDDWLIYGPLVDGWHRALRRRPLLDRALTAVTGFPSARADIGALATQCFISETTERATLDNSPYSLPDRTVVYSGIDRRDFPGCDAVHRDGFGWRLLHVGRLDERKGIDVAIRALAELPSHATLTLLGRGDDRYAAALRSLAAELDVADRVTFGAAPRSELAAHMAEADAFVFPTRWPEPLGIVPVEAMACGLPVVATGSGGSSEYLIEGATCLRFPVDDHVALAEQIRRLADDPTLRERLVATGHRVADELTMDRWVELLERWHRHAVDPGTPRPERRTLPVDRWTG